MLKTVLIVEDDECLQGIFKMALELDGYHVIQAGNGKIALDLMLRSNLNDLPDLILLDIMMPIMDGHIFLKLISKKFGKKLSRIPVVVCSAHGKHEMTPQVAAKVSKPVSLTFLCETVNKILETSAPQWKTLPDNLLLAF